MASLPNALTTVIVEDERLAREELKLMLADDERISLVGEASDLTGARALLERTSPNLLFLDVALADGSGFELFDSPLLDCRVVFVTAYEAHALRAFEVEAVDYLLKPVQRERLRTAVDRAWTQGAGDESFTRLSYEDMLFLRLGERSVFVPVNSILAVVVAGDYTRISVAGGREHLVLRPLKHWESRLPENTFARIHRSAIVNVRKITRLEPWFGQAQRIFIEELPRPLTLSRRYAAKLSDRFGC